MFNGSIIASTGALLLENAAAAERHGNLYAAHPNGKDVPSELQFYAEFGQGSCGAAIPKIKARAATAGDRASKKATDREAPQLAAAAHNPAAAAAAADAGNPSAPKAAAASQKRSRGAKA
ncbi:hypothetical protein COO60DRAFT_1640169 [Scenedesmus sp. NREL 46B-D3]|nr:hypothetical protein COO60DRAFT_1640169 [Scenedesmus sp. NREL 46B-D3]